MQYMKIPNPFNEGWLYKNEPYNKITAWIDLVMSASQEDTDFKLNKDKAMIKKGQVITSIRACAYRWNWSKDKVSNFLKLLEKDKMITKDNSIGMTVITIIDYDNILITEDTQEVKDIQITEENLNILQEETNQIKESQVTKVTRTIKNKYYENNELNQAFVDFVEMRKKVKKPMTPRAIKMAQNKLVKFATNQIIGELDEELAIKILEQSIFKSWTDIYPLKDEQNGNTMSRSQNRVDWSKV